jgi:hypothetical protein
MDRSGRKAAGGFSGNLMQFLIHEGITFTANLIDIANNGACLFICLSYYAWHCEKNSLPKPPMLTTDPDAIREQLCDFLQVNQNSDMIADPVNQTTVHQYFLENYGPEAISRKAVHLSNPTNDVVWCNTFEDYIDVMRFHAAHADELFVWAASRMFNLRLSLLEQFVPRIEVPTLRALVEMGYSMTVAEHALQKCTGDLARAIDFLLQHPPQSSESDVVWREDVHHPAGAFEVRIVRTGRHFQLVLPQYVPKELEPKLPPRTRKNIVAAQIIWEEHNESHGCGGGAAAVPAQPSSSCRKHSAGGGAAAVPHQPPQSFGHITHQGVVEPQTWQKKLQSFFPDLFIFHLVKNIIYSSGEHASSDDEFKTNTILLSSISFYAQKMLENVSSAFMFSAPDITFDEFKTVHRIVTSFQIGAQAFRCTAVVFNDGHVVAFPELKNLQKGDQRRDQQRQEFYDAINLHFQKNPRLVIDKMLLEPCV